MAQAAAAYTAVDLAETNEDAAAAVNARGAGAVAVAAAALGIPLAHVSRHSQLRRDTADQASASPESPHRTIQLRRGVRPIRA